jgi:DNA mismatch repair protein MutH
MLRRNKSGIGIAWQRVTERTAQEANMDWDELLSLITLGAVFPYVGAAAAHWFRKTFKSHFWC